MNSSKSNVDFNYLFKTQIQNDQSCNPNNLSSTYHIESIHSAKYQLMQT